MIVAFALACLAVGAVMAVLAWGQRDQLAAEWDCMRRGGSPVVIRGEGAKLVVCEVVDHGQEAH